MPSSSHSQVLGYPCSLDEEGWVACDACGAYEDDTGNDTETEDEVGAHELTPDEEFDYVGDLTGATEDSLRSEYFLAKRRFRYHTGRAPRRVRFPKRAPWRKGRKGKGKGRSFAAPTLSFKGSPQKGGGGAKGVLSARP